MLDRAGGVNHLIALVKIGLGGGAGRHQTCVLGKQQADPAELGGVLLRRVDDQLVHMRLRGPVQRAPYAAGRFL